IHNPSDVQEKINSYRPGDTTVVSVFRKGEKLDYNVVLQGRDRVVMMGNDGETLELFGATLQSAPQTLLKRLKLKHGVQIAKLERGKFKLTGIKPDFIITHINQIPVTTPQDVVRIIEKARRSVLVEGVYPNGSVCYYGMGV
ncbi:MAG: hypothetical protein IKY70_03530, partial [Bacteroidales bacterium]|nr:hypothetical protein [Bacteroidales bacterium]